MELGAILCTSRAPNCLLCPIRKYCAAHSAGTTEVVPRKKPRPKTVALDEPCAWVLREDHVLLEQQTGSRWRGLWKLPKRNGVPTGDAPLLTLDYPFTHHRVTLAVYPAEAPAVMAENHAWHEIATLAELPLAAPHRRAVERLLSRKS